LQPMNSLRVEPITICVIIPTYNNKLTIEAVLRDVDNVLPDVIVVDDGSTDGASQLLDRIAAISVVRHERNQGKGAALADGFALAVQRGYSHAISLDGDGQHLAADIPRFVQEIEHSPTGMIIGRRNLAGRGRRLKSRILRAHSNFWVWLLTGKWVRDSQTGFRAYPLKRVTELRVKTRRYDFEVEVLVKGLWVGMPVREIPIEVDYVPGSKSHFRPLVDFMRVFSLICALLAKRLCIPLPLLQRLCLKSSPGEAETLGSPGSLPRHYPAAAATGVFWGLTPAWGRRKTAAILCARRLGLSETISASFTHIGFPAVMPLIIYADWLMGRLIFKDWFGAPSAPMGDGLLAQAMVSVLEYLVGGFVLAAGASAAAFMAVAAVCLVKGRKGRNS
jgi:uncharacterized protein (DUF2062 family)